MNLPTPSRRVPKPGYEFMRSNVSALNVVVPGMGKIALQGVGSTARSQGFQGSFLAEGCERRTHEIVPLKMHLDENFKVVWGVAENTWNMRTGPSVVTTYPPGVVEKMFEMLEELPVRYEVGLMFEVMDAALFEVREHDHRLKNLKDAVDANRQGMTLPNGMKPAEERMEWLRNSLEKNSGKISAMEANSPRIDKLRHLVSEIRAWTHIPATKRTRPFVEVMEEALRRGEEIAPRP